ncbi:MAG: RagB/SusD family nutrient uptake outer membrane protein [Dysgonamonadaceae bacterium]|jgi:hypothetical protein|nr:RagB/SusD family nutrient uptake outer membrane protein [Dysgonamonadaceae bacterium]
MKQIRLYTVLIFIPFCISACSDWLDGALPKDKNLDEAQFATESGINSVLNGLYTTLSDADLYGEKLTTTDVELLAHYYYYIEDISVNPNYIHFTQTSNYKYSESTVSKSFEDIWIGAYDAIFKMNRFIESVQQTTVLSENKKNALLGEVYGLRAFVHLDLFRLFGDINDMQKIPYNQSAEVIPHDPISVADFQKCLLADLDMAETLLQNDPVRTEGKILDFKETSSQSIAPTELFTKYFRNFRMNYFAILALKARTLLYFGNAEEAAATAQRALSEAFGENADAGKPFYWVDKAHITDEKVKDFIFYPEVLFGIHNLDLHTDWEANTGGNQGGLTYTVYEDNLRYNIFRNDITTSDLSLWEDIRAKQWTSSRVGFGQLISNKFTQYDTKVYNPKEYMQPLIRTGELFYIIAEFMVDRGLVQDAMTYLNDFRFHRGVQYTSLPDPATITKEKAYDILETEYYKEFYGEGQAFFFLKRRGNTKIINASASGTKDISPDNYLVPVPQKELNN